MNDTIATNIRTLREAKPWTQAHLAEAAGVAERTIQRAEEGKGLSAETLQAVAGALDVPIELLRLDARDYLGSVLGVPREQITPELVAARIAEANARFTKVPLIVLRAPSDLAVVYEAYALRFDTRSISEEAQDLAAELHQSIFDLMEIGRDVGPQQQREFMKDAFDQVTKLNSIGCATSIGLHRHLLRIRGEDQSKPAMPWATLYVIVTPLDNAPPFAAIEKSAPYRLG